MLKTPNVQTYSVASVASMTFAMTADKTCLKINLAATTYTTVRPDTPGPWNRLMSTWRATVATKSNRASSGCVTHATTISALSASTKFRSSAPTSTSLNLSPRNCSAPSAMEVSGLAWFVRAQNVWILQFVWNVSIRKVCRWIWEATLWLNSNRFHKG